MRLKHLFLAALGMMSVGAPRGIGGTLIPPTGLHAGDHYRLAFVTSGSWTALSTRITDYDDFVSATANALSSVLAPLATDWLVIGSTATVNAIDHINLGSAPIYRADGLRIANNGADFWDGVLQTPISFDETGTQTPVKYVFTGTLPSGIGNALLGAPPTLLVHLGRTDLRSAWSSVTQNQPTFSYAFYGISSTDLVVPGGDTPEPGTWSLILIGSIVLAGSGCYRVRRLAALDNVARINSPV